MPKENKSRYVVLGMLSEAPMSGYDIKKVCDNTLEYFWNENYGNIYPVLSKLKEEGSVTMVKHVLDGSPDKKEYHITEKGLEILSRWLQREPSERHLREELLLQLYFGHKAPISVTLNKLENRKRNCIAIQESLVNRLEDAKKDVREEKNASPEDFDLSALHYAVNQERLLVFGFSFYQMEIDWCEASIKELKELEKRAENLE